ncbi:MAG: SDR family NAD(P)-dependent oxidoreductase [Thermoanaerobaculales bacterium]|nr:SDR family NAD(P)-dependent oxidoreductase [Thermoanaerobaculales bacterium]
MKKMKMNGKVALITGASSGIGAALAREYGRLGAEVVLSARRVDRLESLVEELEASGCSALAVPCDVTRDGDPERAVEAAIERFGRIDHVQANAGFGVAGWFHKLGVEDYRRQFDTNVFGVIRTVGAVREALIESRGCLALMGSVNSYVALPGTSPYSMSKHAVMALAGSLRHEFGVHGVSVTLVAPGFVDSEIRQVDNQGRHTGNTVDPIPDWLRMDAMTAARKIVRGVSRRRRVVLVTGHGKAIVFLQRHFPGFTEFLVRRVGVRGRKEPKGGVHRTGLA